MSGNNADNLRDIDRSNLIDINTVKIDTALPKGERIRSYIDQIINPYCYLDGDIVVGISYTDTDVSLEERLKAYASGIE